MEQDLRFPWSAFAVTLAVEALRMLWDFIRITFQFFVGLFGFFLVLSAIEHFTGHNFATPMNDRIDALERRLEKLEGVKP